MSKKKETRIKRGRGKAYAKIGLKERHKVVDREEKGKNEFSNLTLCNPVSSLHRNLMIKEEDVCERCGGSHNPSTSCKADCFGKPFVSLLERIKKTPFINDRDYVLALIIECLKEFTKVRAEQLTLLSDTYEAYKQGAVGQKELEDIIRDTCFSFAVDKKRFFGDKK